MNQSVVGTTKAKLPQKGRVLLQTAKTLAYGSDKSKHVGVRVLLDLGGQRSFISENVKNKLGLKSLKSEIVNLNTFGDNKYHKRKCPGGELPYEEYMGVCHELGSHFQGKIPKRVCQFLTKIPERAIIFVRNSR